MPVTRNQSNSAENAKAVSATAGGITSGPKETSQDGITSVEMDPPRPDSPDNCSICLGPYSNKSFTSSCAHSFCFICLKQWSKVKAECPLCKQSFTSIFHNIRSNDSYDIYELPPVNPPHQFDFSEYFSFLGGNLNTFATTQYMSLPQPSLNADLTLSNFSRFQFRNRRYDRYLNPIHQVSGEHQYSYSNTAFNPVNLVSASSWPTGTEAFRLRVYRFRMGPPAVILGCENSTYRLTPMMVNASAHRIQRIMPWLTRELRVLLRSHQSVRLAVSIIQPLLYQVTIDSEYFSERVSPLIGHKSRQFIQEFIAFTNSALSMQAFDRKAMYRRHAIRFWDETTSSNSSDDDVVEITNVSPDVSISNVTGSLSNTAVNFQVARWDSPTPGPSWDIMDTHISIPRAESDRVSISSESDPVFIPDVNDADADDSETGSDIVFLKFDKPWNERSPIRLSSDSEGERNKKRRKLKHGKKQRQILDSSVDSTKKDKKYKSRSKERLRPSHSSSEDELEQKAEVNDGHKTSNLSLSDDRHKKKKHKRSKDKKDHTQKHNDRDRELVDRLFAQTFTQQQQNENSASDDAGIPCSSTSKDKSTAKSSNKDRHKRKKKKRSRSPSTFALYKKHHSGHKRSVDKNESGRGKRKHKSRRKSKEDATSDYSDRTESLEKESQNPRNQPSTNTGHSVASAFLARTDNVQHIPLNLWVATWPSLPVTHRLPAPSVSSTIPLSTSLPHPMPTSPGFSGHRFSYSLSERTNPAAVNSHTISSDSQPSSDTDDVQHTSENKSSPADCSRTKQWLDANFSISRQNPSGISSLPTTSSNSVIGRNLAMQNSARRNEFEVGAQDVFSITDDGAENGTRRTARNTRFDSPRMKTRNCDVSVNVASSSDDENLCAKSSVHNQALKGPTSGHNMSCIENEKCANVDSSSSNIKSSLLHSTFQPFKLHRKPVLAKKNYIPFFIRMVDDSDEDNSIEEADDEAGNENPYVRPRTFDREKANNLRKLVALNSALKTNLTSSTSKSKVKPHTSTSSSPAVTTPVSEGSQQSCLNSELNVKQPSSSSSSSSTSQPVFSILPALQTPVMPPALTSTLSYLPFKSLSTSSPLPPPLSFVTPQAPLPAVLPLHFPYSPQSTAPAVFPDVNTSSYLNAAIASSDSLALRENSNSSCQLLPNNARFTRNVENNETDNSSELSGVKISTSACPQNFSAFSAEVHGAEAEFDSLQISSDVVTKDFLMSEMSD